VSITREGGLRIVGRYSNLPIPFQEMNSRIFISILVLLTVPNLSLCAQDFEADSIYYTPIPKVKPGESRKVEPAKRPNPFAEAPGDSTISDKFIEYFFNVQVGALIGCSDCISEKEVSFTASTVHGITVGDKFRLGGGIGFDSYLDWQTMPIFASLSWDLLGTKNTNALFLQFNYGFALPWRTEHLWEVQQTGVDGGQMVYGMAGMRFKYHDLRLSFSIGGKVQALSSYFETPNYYVDINGNPVQGTSSKTSIEETMKRLAVTITIGWK
jgi:hypothetical protein